MPGTQRITIRWETFRMEKIACIYWYNNKQRLAWYGKVGNVGITFRFKLNSGVHCKWTIAGGDHGSWRWDQYQDLPRTLPKRFVWKHPEQVLQRSKPSKSNIGLNERMAPKNFCDRDVISVLDVQDYKRRMRDLLDPAMYNKLSSDPTQWEKLMC